MKGKKNWSAAAQEAKEEAGVIGKTHKHPVGQFQYFKRKNMHFDLCRVEVYILNYEKQLESYREMGQRDAYWFTLEEAAEAVQEPGLIALLQSIDFSNFRKPVRKKPPEKTGKAKNKR